MKNLKVRKDKCTSVKFLECSLLKNKTILLKIAKTYNNKAELVSCVISADDVKAIVRLKQKEVEQFRAILRKYTAIEKLALNSQSRKLNFTMSNSASQERRYCFNRVAQCLNRVDLVVDYSKKAVIEKLAVARARKAVKKVAVKK